MPGKNSPRKQANKSPQKMKSPNKGKLKPDGSKKSPAEMGETTKLEEPLSTMSLNSVPDPEQPTSGANSTPSDDERSWKDIIHWKIAHTVHLMEVQNYVSEQEHAEAAFDFLESFVLHGEYTTVRQLLENLMNLAAELHSKFPIDSTYLNMMVKIRKLVTEEFFSIAKSSLPLTKSSRIFVNATAYNCDINELPHLPEDVSETKVADDLRSALIGVLMEFKNELENIPNVIGNFSGKIIENGENILTFSYCPNLAQFIRDACQQASIRVFILESAPFSHGHLLADALQDTNIELVMVNDLSIVEIMPRITKVFMSCKSVNTDGDIATYLGGMKVATVAKQMGKPVYAIAASYQLNQACGGAFINTMLNPFLLEPIMDTSMNAIFRCYKYDVLPRDKIDRIVTNLGVITPIQLHRVVTEYYAPKKDAEES